MNGVVLLRVDRVTVGNGHPRHLHPALDLKILQAGLEAAGTPVALVDGWLLAGGPDAWLRQALGGGPRVAVIKAETWCLPEAVECARRLREAGVVTIAVGQQVSHAMRATVPGWREAFDLAIPGEVLDDVAPLRGQGDCPGAAKVFAEAVAIPLHLGIDAARLRRIGEILAEAVRP